MKKNIIVVFASLFVLSCIGKGNRSISEQKVDSLVSYLGYYSQEDIIAINTISTHLLLDESERVDSSYTIFHEFYSNIAYEEYHNVIDSVFNDLSDNEIQSSLKNINFLKEYSTVDWVADSESKRVADNFQYDKAFLLIGSPIFINSKRKAVVYVKKIKYDNGITYHSGAFFIWDKKEGEWFYEMINYSKPPVEGRI